MKTANFHTQGLSETDVIASRKKHGQNSLEYKKVNPVFTVLAPPLFSQTPRVTSSAADRCSGCRTCGRARH